MLFPTASIGSLSFRLLLIRPDHQPSAGHHLDVSHRFDTIVGEGRTTIEERMPARRALLLTQICTLVLAGTAADDWRKGLAALGALPVGMPLWIDALPPARWSERIYDPQKIVGFDPATGAFTIYSGPDLPGSPTYPLYAPLLIGRWKKRPEAPALSGVVAQVDLTLKEASPWSCRIGIHATGTTWSPRPDWTKPPKDVSDYGLELIELGGATREPALDRVNAAARWTQEGQFTFADRLAIRTALEYFQTMRGSWDTFPVPAWFQPGAATDATPDSYTARFASDNLTLSYLSGACAQATIGFIQQIATPSRAQNRPGEFYLYQLKYQHDTPNPELSTNCDQPLVLSEGTYQPLQVSHQDIRRSLKPQDDKATITAAYAAGSLMADWISGRLFGWVLLTIWKCDPDDPAGTRGAPIYTGFVTNVRPDGNKLTIEATLFGSLLKARAPGDVFGPQCNTYVFSPRCGLSEASLRSTGTATRAHLGADLRTLTISDATGTGGPTYAAQYFAKGILRTGSGRATQIATIVSSDMVAGALQIKTARPLWSDLIASGGQALQLVPGCDGQYSTCGTKFANTDNFRGFPFIPDYIETPAVAPMAVKTPKK